MKKMMKSALVLTLALVMVLSCLSFVGCSKKQTIVIYTSAEEFRIEYMNQRFKEKFPEYEIRLEYMSSGDQSTLLQSAGTDAECQITHDLEYGTAANLESIGVLANLKDSADFSKYVSDAAPSTYYTPELRNGGAIILNMDVIEEKGLDIPTSYEDLLDPQYKGLISMPDPKKSGTGYMFLLSLVNTRGEEEAFNYFTALYENLVGFESSGSGPVNKLITKEAAIGFGMISHAVQQINEGQNFKILFFEEGAPYSLYGQAVIAGNEENKAVMEVFNFLSNELTEEMCERFYPEKIYKDKDFTIQNFPTDIQYSDMSNNTPARKAELLEKWVLS